MVNRKKQYDIFHSRFNVYKKPNNVYAKKANFERNRKWAPREPSGRKRPKINKISDSLRNTSLI